jgi:6-phosphogluconolactonase (cycloisomerase 2 family)
MRPWKRVGAAALTFAAVTATAGGFGSAAFAESASVPAAGAGVHAVFVETDNTAANQVAAYARAADGSLTLSAVYQTGGLGGALTGAAVDFQASQGALAYDDAAGLLLATNAGSNNVSVFAATGPFLQLRQIVSSGGDFPVSVTVHGNLVYVLNARSGGSVSGFKVAGGHLVPLAGSTRALGLSTTATPEFTNTPGQVAFSPDGRLLLVTTKANGDNIDVFHVDPRGSLSAQPVVNPEPGTVPFALTFTSAHRLQVVEAGPSAVVTFSLSAWGDLTQIASSATGQAAACWIVHDGRYSYVSNAGSATVTGFSRGAGGVLTDLGNTSTDPGTVDAATAAHGAYLYVRAGANGNLDEFSVNSATGSLTSIGSLTVADAAGGEGIATS